MVLDLAAYLTQLCRLGLQCVYWCFLSIFGRGKKPAFRSAVHHVVFAGVNSLPILFLILFLVGMILAYNSAYQLKKLGVMSLVPTIVSVALTREIGPLLTAIVIAARVGASYTAELGTMRVSEEITALDTLAIDPVRYLIAPRFIAMLLLFPLLVTCANCIGIAGGMAVGVLNLDMTPVGYFRASLDSLVQRDLNVGLIKSFFFAAIIVLVSCHEGLSVTGGAEGVGRATTRSVVNIIVLVIASNLIFAALFFLQEQWAM
jgi:phospholipid/cholesterol/gamma-HCH transport system permease protein